MAGASVQQQEWVRGFLFVGNQLALDFLNTKPILDGEARELLSNTAALEQWLVAFGIVTSQKDRALVQNWRDSCQAEAFLQELIAFRERLRATVLRLEGGLVPADVFLADVNMLLERHPQRSGLSKRGSKMVLNILFEPRTPGDVWAPIAAATAELLSKLEPSRIRKCESDSCVVHFYDTSKKGLVSEKCN